MDKKNKFPRLGIFLAIISLFLLITITLNIQNYGQLYSFDLKINQFIPTIQSPELANIILLITNILQPAILILLALIISYFVFKRHGTKKTLVILISLALGIISKLGLNYILLRARPENALVNISEYSFPSGHATFACLFFIILIFSLKHSISRISKISLIITSILMILLISFTRIYLNVHYLSDVIAGLLLGIFIFFLSSSIIKHK